MACNPALLNLCSIKLKYILAQLYSWSFKTPFLDFQSPMGKNRQKNRKRDRRLGDLQYDAAGKQIDDRDTEAGKSFGYKDIVRENKLFEDFYKAQGICPDDQWDEMMLVLKTDLPASFRITGTRSQVGLGCVGLQMFHVDIASG